MSGMKATHAMEQQRWRSRMLFLHALMLSAPLWILGPGTGGRVLFSGRCLFKALLGIDCPACGVTHAVGAMLSGNVVESFHYHPAGPFITAALVVLTSYFSLALLMRHRALIEWGKEVKIYTGIELAVIVALCAGWLGKMLTR
jgi:hypothetical protein